MLPRNDSAKDSTAIGKSRPEKGNFAVYTVDGRRFAVPLAYLENPIFIELLKMSEEEFGLSGNAPITLPCDGVFMDYVVSLVQRCVCVCEDVEKALVISMGFGRCCYTSSLLQQEQANQQINTCSWILKKPFYLHVKNIYNDHFIYFCFTVCTILIRV
ncbi:hypothetical protein AAC387_Pa07g1080 [Persea americana]